MPLSLAQQSLEQEINAAYRLAKDLGAGSNKSDFIVENLGKSIGQAIHNYFLQASVVTTDKIDSGQLDIPAGGSSSSGTGTGAGFLT